jgi:hypothetical protein
MRAIIMDGIDGVEHLVIKEACTVCDPFFTPTS